MSSSNPPDTSYLDSLRGQLPEEDLDKLRDCAAKKLYHQLTVECLRVVRNDSAWPLGGKTKAEFWDKFMDQFSTKMNTVVMLEILEQVTESMPASEGLKLTEKYGEMASKSSKDSQVAYDSQKAIALVRAGDIKQAREILDAVEEHLNDIDWSYGIDPAARSSYHRAAAFMHQERNDPPSFYRESMRYLLYTPLAAIPEKERGPLAFKIAVAALISPKEFGLGDLLQQPLFSEFLPTCEQYSWVMDFVQALHDGVFAKFDQAIADHKAKWEAVPELKKALETDLKHKMSLSAMMEMAFQRPKKQRSAISFDDIAKACRVGDDQVEDIFRKTMCAGLIKGSIDEVNRTVKVTWVRPRVLDMQRLELLKFRLEGWSQQATQLLQEVEELTPELLVS
ncbi:26S proteasome non-ATPase regulatory subunit, putative [Perkinsus marinus ATCC 50983]|uniref:26S proteasome non-ATPase regulatory subunit, putative n=1 Tax=Perkinsus marinus (strain ATCC 50983 / TXsc) TaxID=423536 RepID=C5KLA7_PERM5|nr:26S proteasome non-ATPase regulatory subunit, putative [Perkinsus marinus ATCC 50983]EER14780.1 26S proteasome non-ATPase regulatory subunit, putative [Perkinsus marinus ATCC 50983]|eukprot:XP_002782984.1 26S proteasome non-ATPase regulatory subunit, putative [Perkinsus marinus ATCC 50983]